MSKLTHVVGKVFRDGDTKRLGGEVVSVGHIGDRRLDLMEDQRFLAPIPATVEPVQAIDGRWFVDRETVERYGLQQQRPAAKPGPATEIRPESESETQPAAVEPDEALPEVDATEPAIRLADANDIDIAALAAESGKRVTKAAVQAAINAKD